MRPGPLLYSEYWGTRFSPVTLRVPVIGDCSKKTYRGASKTPISPFPCALLGVPSQKRSQRYVESIRFFETPLKCHIYNPTRCRKSYERRMAIFSRPPRSCLLLNLPCSSSLPEILQNHLPRLLACSRWPVTWVPSRAQGFAGTW